MIGDRKMPSKVRVLIVDDSVFFQRRISEILSTDDRIEVVGTARNGLEGVEQARRLRPDVITMDVEMPVMDGITAVKQIMSNVPTPILMLSSYTSEGAKATLDALNAGAVDFIPKQSNSAYESVDRLSTMLVQRVLAIHHKGVVRSASTQVAAVATSVDTRRHAPLLASRKGSYDLVVIGASTGGPVAIQQLLGALPSTFPVPMVLVVHMPGSFTKAYAERLNALCALNVSEAVDGEQLLPGMILLAPGGKQLSFERKGARPLVRVRDGLPEETYKPCIDITLESAAHALRNSVLAVILTGMGSDGSRGASMLKQCDSTVWSQDEASCIVYGMPQAIEKRGLSDLVLPLNDIGPTLVKAV
jgi:two-component system, chemotaxis family, protein-glutamate methylesterase/glutaminase